MKVLHISTFERTGGAAIAASRLHIGIRLLGHESTLLVRERTQAERVEGAVGLDQATCPSTTSNAIDALFFQAYRSSHAAGVDYLFSSDLPTRPFSVLPVVKDADIVNVHWTAGMLSVAALRGIQDLGKPVVWTLHDQAAFTGGCHYSGDCQKYVEGCARCPYLREDAAHLPALVLSNKRRWLDVSRLAVVCPSEWLSDCARASALLREADVRTIPNSVPVDTYQRPERDEARARFGLPRDAIVLLAGADRFEERRKGHEHMIAALKQLIAGPVMRQRFASRSIVCAAFGDGELVEDGIPFVRLGRLSGDNQVAQAYRAADVFLLPTLEDNLPNTLIESFAAGTAVVAYATGGTPDVMRDGECGVLVARGDVAGFAAGIRLLVDDHAARARMRKASAAVARQRFDLPVQAAAYLALYEELLKSTTASRTSISKRAATPVERWEREVAATEAEVLAGACAVPQLSARILTDLCSQIATHQEMIAARGGEIAALEVTTHELRAAVNSFDLRLGTCAAERAALKKRLRSMMKRAVIFGSGDQGRRVWEALARCGAVDIAGFVDDDPRRQGRAFLGTTVYPPDWLRHAMWDVVVVASPRPNVARDYLEAAGIRPDRIVECPLDLDDAALSAVVTTAFPDPMALALANVPIGTGLKIGIFGTGVAAMKVWEAISDLDCADAVWFADNNPAQQGRTLLWLDVIAPAAIASRPFDAIVIGSMSRDAIHQQLLALGVARERVLAPDVVAPLDQVRSQLEAALSPRLSQEVAQ